MTPSAPGLISHRGQPCLALELPAGDRVLVALHGGQVLSWRTADGIERLYLSPRAVFDGRSAIRGGVPLCFPQFNARGLLPRHGFARNLPWTVLQAPADLPDGSGRLRLQLRDSDATRAIWPQAFVVTLTVTLEAGRLRLDVEVDNTGEQPLNFSLALHTYVGVDDIGATTLEGLERAPYQDAAGQPVVPDVRRQEGEPLHFGGEIDRIYLDRRSSNELRLRHAGGTLQLSQSDSFTETVVWNPGSERCAALADMPADGYRQMLCLEAARVAPPVTLAPGARWTGWQQLQCD